jgi:hypothetical protein
LLITSHSCWLLSFANAPAVIDISGVAGISDVAGVPAGYDIPSVVIASLLFLGVPICLLTSPLFLESLPLIGSPAAVGGLVFVALPAVAGIPTPR